ncbi:von Willebrand factor D and EGF domain-containing protein-like [Pomacea canaliculata]|uniref:von Willebrand factor D and EGF domain-containing protein-like n=1 Tax=Pomacea canaliculata TaxID=400727 RepID=UPI000D735FC2|nr:von Willebrand factor D and EGF domain-containing protein-like [Pomacea canaliculata]
MWTGCECEVDPCLPNCYTELADTHRSVGYTAQYPLTPLCDISLQSGWYRFANGMMPEICVPRFHCGTIVPVWMAGKHPNEEEGIVARKACANFETGGEQSNPCCEHSVQIAVKNCGDFFVYYLQPTPACPVAYCAGPELDLYLLVQVMLNSHVLQINGQRLDLNHVQIDTDPVLKGPEVTNNSFRFSCEIPAQNNDPNQMFEVVWTFDGHVDSAIPSTVLKSTDHVAYLPGSSLKGHMGTNVGCKVRTYYSGRNVTSPWLDSNTYWAGIRTNPPSLQISEKEEIRNVTLTSTIPIVCDHNYTCCLTVKLDVDGPKTSKDLITDGNKDVLLSFEQILTAGGGPYLGAFDGYRFAPTQIKVLDVPTKSCSLVGDPHITSLESSRPYDMFKIGDYTMYQNPKRDFEMQVRTWPCGHVSCVCGVVIREKNDVIRVDECDQPYAGHHTSPKVEVYSKPLREGTVIQRSTDGHEVTVNLPSSTEVKVTAADYGLDVHLLAPPVDSGEARGLCGTFDGNPNNEFTHRDGHVDPVCHYCPRPDSFTDSWRNNRSTSLFESLPVKVSDNYEASYCTCDKGTNNDVIANCASRGAIPNTVMKCQACSNITNLAPIFGGNIGGWTRRSAPAYNDVDEPDPRFNPEDHKDFQPGNPTWPTPSGITQQQAHTKCLETLHGSQIWTHCQGSQDIVDTYLQNCVADTLFTDGYTFLEGILSSFTTECQMELSRDPNNYVTSPDGKLMMKPEISTDICSAICLRHGRCNRGQCICDTGYEGDNCHLLAGVGPQLARVRSSNVCDINERPCRKVFIDATNIALTDQLMCRVQEVLPDGSVSHDAFIQEGHFLSSGRLACALPDARIKSERSVKTFVISATNDGRIYGNQVNVTVFDSRCQTCRGGTCQQKSSACLINNLCYLDGERNPANTNEVCQVTYSTTMWKNLQTTSGRYPTMTPPTLSGPDADFILTCTLHSDDVSSSARFEVTWYVNDQRQKSETLYGAARESTYNLPDMPTTSGKVYCMARSFYRDVSVFSGYLTSEAKMVQKPS